MNGDDLDRLRSPYPNGRKPEWAGTTWTPSFTTESDDEGEVRSVPHAIAGDAEPDDAAMLTEVGLDATVWQVMTRRESRWQRFDGEWLQAFKLTVKRRGAGASDLTVDQMAKILKSYRSRPRAAETTSGTMIVAVADLQAGKIDGGGSAALVDRFGRITADIKAHIEARKPSKLILVWGGDCVEGVISQGGRLSTRLDLSVTEQLRLYRRLALHEIAELAPLANEVKLAVVAGNHDESTRQFDMGPNDSWAIEGMSAVADALAMSGGKYSNVSFVYPEHEELNVVLNAGTEEHPYIVGVTHGHLAASPAKVCDWWKGQAHGQQAIGRAQLLITGHWHHLRVEDSGTNKCWLQLPAFDGGSDYFRRRRGENTQAGMVTLDVTGVGRGWANLRIWE